MTESISLDAKKSPDYAAVLAELNRNHEKTSSSLDHVFALLTERGATTLGVSRATIWLFTSAERVALRCIDCMDTNLNEHTSTNELLEIEVFPEYIAALKHERVIRADRAESDPRTAEFSTQYLAKNDIKSTLDAPIRQDGGVVGVICIEQTETYRTWTDAEADFVATLSDFATIALLDHHKHLADAALIHAQKMESLGRLAGGIAHDFNNLLTVITGAIDMLKLKLDGPQQFEHMLDLIAEASQRGKKITRNLLAFGGRQDLDLSNINIADLLEQVSTLTGSIIREDIEVFFDPGDAKQWIKVDQTQLEQVILNLMLNAMDAMPSGGTLEVSALPPNDAGFVGIAVTDTGSGIADQIIDSVFDPFFSTKGDFGSGLGLSISLGIVQQHDGDLTCTYSSKQGTRFEVRLPRATALQATPTSPSTVAATDDDPAPLTILLVEDDSSVRDIVAQMLQVSGYIPLVADNAAHALALVTDNHIDLLVSDVVMPDRRGPDLYQDALKIKPDLNALFVSGYSEEFISETSIGKNVVGYLSKPFTLNQFRGAILQVLSDASTTR